MREVVAHKAIPLSNGVQGRGWPLSYASSVFMERHDGPWCVGECVWVCVVSV